MEKANAIQACHFGSAVRRRLVAIALCSMLTACSGGGGSGESGTSTNSGTPSGTNASASAATTVQTLEVPEVLARGTFSTSKTLNVPPGMGIRLWARVNNARFLVLAPNGDVLVSIPDAGEIHLLRTQPNDVPQDFLFASGLRKPHDMVFHTIGSTVYLYITESHQVTRMAYHGGDTTLGAREVVVADLPDASSPELNGSYGHELKNIAIAPDNKLYVSIASDCNACAEDAQASPVRGAIYQYDADGRNGRLFARGLRNAEGLDFIPGTNTLWVAVNNRDEIKVPSPVDVDGDGSTDLGKLLPSFVDDNPPELFTAVRDGGNYGWPFCNSVPNTAMTNLELANDAELNSDGTRLNCRSVDRSSKGIHAHSAPLGLSFLHASNVPAAYRKGAVVALHGCWNCTALTAGFKVVYFPFDDAGNAGTEIDLVSGFVIDPQQRTVWGRPVDAIADAQGNILISDDYAGAVYQLYPK